MRRIKIYWSFRFAGLATSTAILCSSLLFFGFGGAKISGQRDLGAGSTTSPQTIYVTDFEIDVENVQSRQGPVQSLRQGRGSRPHIFSKSASDQEDPADRARELIDLMSASLVKELTKQGLKAERIEPGKPFPDQGLLVRGVFTQADQGNRLRRATIGLGAGETELQAIVSVDDLAQGRPKPFYELDTSAESRKLPGAIITKNPYVAAAKFVLSARDLDKNVTQTASKIATEIAGRIHRQDEASQ